MGQTATLTVVAIGTAPLIYQWQRNGVNIAGAAAASYTTAPATAADNGTTYRCIVSNSAGTATSQVATLTVTSLPTNRAPSVIAGPDQTIKFPAAAQLNGSVSDDGLPNPPGTVTITWSKTKGPGTVTFANPASPSTTAMFSRRGTYVLRLRATDGSLSISDRVRIVVTR